MTTEKKMQLVDWLDDLSVRFIINLPKEELKSVERICFQVEEAQWFYEDFIRPLDPELPSLNLRNFCLSIFQHCPMLSEYSTHLHAQAFEEFLAYKTRVPVRGAIMLNEKMDQVVLVKGWKKGANWSFPRGKINKDEPDLDCAIREVYEETGYDIRAAGLVSDEENTKSIEISLREQHMRLYVFRGVPMDIHFEPRTRKEISKIQWWKLTDLPTQKKKNQQKDGKHVCKGEDVAISANKFYMVASFLGQLKKWISEQRSMDKLRLAGEKSDLLIVTDEEPQQPEIPYTNGNPLHPSSDTNFGTLINGLPQPAQSANKIELPKAVDLSAQLLSMLGVQSTPPTSAMTPPSTNVPFPTGVADNSKANELLALLQPNLTTQLTQSPPKPVEQVAEHSRQPRSPPHPLDKPLRLSTPPSPPEFPPARNVYEEAMARPQQLHPPQTRPIQPPSQPAQLVPRSIHSVHHKIRPMADVRQQTIPPYQRTGDPQFVQHSQASSGNNNSSIPPASKLPQPQLNPNSAELLKILKTGQLPETPQHIVNSCANALPVAQPVNAVLATNAAPQAADSNDTAGLLPGQSDSRQSSDSVAGFVKPQISPGAHLAKAEDVAKPKSEHIIKPISHFPEPSKPGVEPAKPRAGGLQLPPAPVELSALPATPGHSREPSGKATAAKALPPMPAQERPVNIQKRLQPKSAKSPNPPVSATINGPLNVPQFDMLAKAAKEVKHSMQNNHHHVQPQKRSPITILARPGSSHAPVAAIEPKPAPESRSVRQGKVTVPKVQTYVTPIKTQPSTPSLKDQDRPAKPFHPQILRRPPQASDLNEPSPIQPLPSPKHNTLMARRSSKPADPQKSLLSLVTKPPPIISPPSAAPIRTINPIDLISPLPPTPTPQEQAAAAFARLSKTVGPLSRNNRVPPAAPSQPAMLRPDGRINSALAVGPKFKKDTAKQTPIHKKKTPAETKDFFSGYLAGVK